MRSTEPSALSTRALAAPDVARRSPIEADAASKKSDLFFPLTQGTYWLYHGTVSTPGPDPESEQPATSEVTLKMTVEKVIQKPDFTLAVISGYPSDLDWSTGEVEPKPWVLIETKTHEVYLNALAPGFDITKLEKDATTPEKLLHEENLLFRWPLKKGLKFGDAESLKRDDNQYCWFVMSEEKKDLARIKGFSSNPVDVFLLRYATNPDDTELELAPGVGILSYQYHHHGTVAETNLTLIEFHLGEASHLPSGANP
jgi:hypothetical protein